MKNSKKLFVLCAITAGILGGTLCVNAMPTEEAQINSNDQMTANINVNLREKPTTHSDVVVVVSKGENIKLLNKEGSWDHVRYNGVEGYCYSKYLDKTDKRADSSQRVTATVSVNVRQEPNMQDNVIGYVKKGEKVTVLDVVGHWFYIEYAGGKGYSYETFFNDGLDDNGNPAISAKTTAQLNLRESANPDAVIKDTMPKDSSITILGQEGDWYKVDYNGREGYCYVNYVEAK